MLSLKEQYENYAERMRNVGIKPLSYTEYLEKRLEGELDKTQQEKDLGITEVRGAKANIPDLQVYGDGDTFALLCKASSQSQGWMKSTKVCNVPGGCIVQVTTQQRNPDGSYAVAEALTYVPNVHIDTESNPRRLVAIESELEKFRREWYRMNVTTSSFKPFNFNDAKDE
jgi:hypothetical protein